MRLSPRTANRSKTLVWLDFSASRPYIPICEYSAQQRQVRRPCPENGQSTFVPSGGGGLNQVDWKPMPSGCALLFSVSWLAHPQRSPGNDLQPIVPSSSTGFLIRAAGCFAAANSPSRRYAETREGSLRPRRRPRSVGWLCGRAPRPVFPSCSWNGWTGRPTAWRSTIATISTG